MRHVNPRCGLPGLRNVALKTTHFTILSRRWNTTEATATSAPEEETYAQSYITSEDGHRTLRARQYGNKPLPLPTFMDPILVAAKERHREPKLKKCDVKKHTDFQIRLQGNAYAQALAGPPRQCVLTQVRLPRAFLLRFGMNASDIKRASETTPDRPKVHLGVFGHEDLLSDTTSHMVGTKAAVEHMCRGKPPKWTRLVNMQFRRVYAKFTGKDAASVNGVKDFVWSNDMPNLVEQDLRDILWRRLNVAFNTGSVVELSKALSNETLSEPHFSAAICLNDTFDVTTGAQIQQVTSKGAPVYHLKDMVPREVLKAWRTKLPSSSGVVLVHAHPDPHFHRYLIYALEGLRRYVGVVEESSQDAMGDGRCKQDGGELSEVLAGSAERAYGAGYAFEDVQSEGLVGEGEGISENERPSDGKGEDPEEEAEKDFPGS